MTVQGERQFWVSSFGLSLLSIVSRESLSRWSMACLNSRSLWNTVLRRAARLFGIAA
jgi:hypothetical protein